MNTYRHWTPPPSHGCDACEGRGRTFDLDEDEYGPIRTVTRCESCEGSGSLTHCVRCGDVMSVPAAELASYRCGPCTRELEIGDYENESARLRRCG